MTRRAARSGKAAPKRTRDRPTFHAGAWGVAAIFVLAGVVLWLGNPASAPRTAVGGPFTLVEDDGRTVTERSFPSKYLAIYFGYTACRDVCPTTMANLTAALARLGGVAGRVQPLFITVDPRRDSPAVLRRFVANFAPGLRGLTGSAEELGRVCREFHVLSATHATETGQPDDAIDHSSVIYLLTPDGALAAPIPADATEMVMARALQRAIGAPS